MPNAPLYLGLDLGTSGCRAMVIDAGGQVHAHAAVPLPAPLRDGAAVSQNPELWWQAVCAVMREITRQVPAEAITALAVDGTSATVVLTDAAGTPLVPALMYNDARAVTEAAHIALLAPAASGAHGASSALAKLLWLQRQPYAAQACHVLHQADWIAARLCGRYGVSDENNALKLGYDAVTRRWPSWLDALNVPRAWWPEVRVPGEFVATVSAAAARDTGLALSTRVMAGTTDSTAAFLATGAQEVGDAVTVLGSTLVLKVLAARPVFAPQFGVYSQRVGERWLVGGASNSGGAVLRQFFTPEQMVALTSRLHPDQPTGLNYYPLPAPGERFPSADPHLAPRIAPRPADDARYFQGLLEGIAAIEHAGYQRLAALGAPYPTTLRTTGGGAVNSAWTEMRVALLGVPRVAVAHTEAAYGAALLARGLLGSCYAALV